jgi:hypothetical protein
VTATPVTLTGNGAFQHGTMNAPAPATDSYQKISVTTGRTTQAITFYVDDISLTDTVATPSTPVYDNCTSTTFKGLGSSISGTFTVGASSNRALYVVVSYDDAARAVSSVTYGAASLTLVKKTSVTSGAATSRSGGSKPPRRGQRRSPSRTATPSSTSSGRSRSRTLTRPHRSRCRRRRTPASGAHIRPSRSRRRSPKRSLAVAQSRATTGQTLTVDGTQTSRWSTQQYTTYGDVGAGATQAGAASVSMGWNSTNGSQPWEVVADVGQGDLGERHHARRTRLSRSSRGRRRRAQTLSGTDGTWSNTPTAFSYQWNRAGTAISGANGAHLHADRRRRRLDDDVHGDGAERRRVGGGDVGGDGRGGGARTGERGAPVSYGPVTAGSTIATQDGTWNNTPTSFTYQLRKETVAGNGTYANVVGTDRASYVTVTADVGYSFEWTVTAVNAYGSTAATSTVIGPITAAVIPDPPDVPGRTLSLTALSANTLTLDPLDE